MTTARIGMGLALYLAACAPGGDAMNDGSVDSDGVLRTCEGGVPKAFIVTEILFSPVVDGVTEGFDLDGSHTGSGNDVGCGVEDHESPDGTEGIDNSFARLLPVLDLTEAAAAEEVIAEAIRSGDILLMVQITGIDDDVDDDCVRLEILQGLGVPLVQSDGVLVAGQTFERDPEGAKTVVEGSIVDGVVSARGAALTLPISILNANFDIGVTDAAVRLAQDGDGGFEGLLGGGVEIASLLESITDQGVSDEVLQLVTPVLSGATDLAPDENGVCQRMSLTLDIEAAEAFVFEADTAIE